MHRRLVIPFLLIAIATASVSAATAASPAPTAGRDPGIIVPPQIESITPNSGSPGDMVEVKGLSIPADRSKAEVWFTLAPNKTAQGTILRTSQSQKVVSYWVKVPGDDSITASYQGPLYIKIKENGKTTPPRQFRIIPLLPKITSHSPQYGAPGRTTTFRGVNFKSTDEACVSGTTSAQLTFRSATEVAIALPANYPTASSLIRVYLRRKGGLAGPTYIYALDPSVQPGSKTGPNTGQKVESKEEPTK